MPVGWLWDKTNRRKIRGNKRSLIDRREFILKIINSGYLWDLGGEIGDLLDMRKLRMLKNKCFILSEKNRKRLKRNLNKKKLAS